MNAVSNEVAIQRIQQKIEYLQSRLCDPATPERTARYQRLDIEAFSLAIEALRYLDAVQNYEATQANEEQNGN